VTVVCLDPGHGTAPVVGSQLEAVGPGSRTRKLKDGGGAPGEAGIALAIAARTRAELERRGYRVVMTRSGGGYRGGNVERARRCNRAHAALMLRIHADGSSDPSQHGAATLAPALRANWTDDVYRPSLRAARLVQAALVRTTRATDRGVVLRGDLTGFNWADVPVILVETGFLSNPAEAARLRSPAYELRVARGLADGVAAFVGA
jgi:N-acetylmuramoyl-L-alanine amidase